MRYLLFLFCVIFTACQQEGALICTEKNTVPIIQPVKDFFRFKTGSWWVYEEEKTGEKDSVWVSRFSEHGIEYGKWKRECQCAFGKCEEAIYITFENKKYNKNGFYIPKEYYYIYISADPVEYENSSIYMQSEVVYSQGINYEEGQPVSDYYWNVEQLPALEVKGKTFNNILHLSNTYKRYPHEKWYAKNKYLIKYKDTDSTTWNLVNYHIVQ